MSTPDIQHGEAQGTLGPFMLSGPVDKPDPARVPLRGDLAHIDLAGRYFVPHYVVPMVRMVGDCGASLRAQPTLESEILYDLFAGQRFDVLDIAGGWAWGCIHEKGHVGYIPVDDLLDPYA